MTWDMLVLGHRLAPLRWLPEQRCRPAPALLHLPHFTLLCFLACRSASIATVPVRVARGVGSTLGAGSFLTSSRTLTSCRYSLLRLLLVDGGRRCAGVDSLCDCRSRR